MLNVAKSTIDDPVQGLARVHSVENGMACVIKTHNGSLLQVGASANHVPFVTVNDEVIYSVVDHKIIITGTLSSHAPWWRFVDESLQVSIGEVQIILDEAGAITLTTPKARLNISDLGDIILQADHHIHLNSPESTNDAM